MSETFDDESTNGTSPEESATDDWEETEASPHEGEEGQTSA